MTNGISPSRDVRGALERLERDIAEAEERLNNLRAMRQSVELFIDEYGNLPIYTTGTNGAAENAKTTESVTENIVAVFERHPREDFNAAEVLQELSDMGVSVEHERVRVGLYYLANKGRLEKVGRGRFALGR